VTVSLRAKLTRRGEYEAGNLYLALLWEAEAFWGLLAMFFCFPNAEAL